MCGICGIAGNADRDRLEAMLRTLVHRGPDSGGTHVDGPVALGARRLSIIDLAGGDQPIENEDGSLVVVQNGEIYNYPRPPPPLAAPRRRPPPADRERGRLTRRRAERRDLQLPRAAPRSRASRSRVQD